MRIALRYLTGMGYLEIRKTTTTESPEKNLLLRIVMPEGEAYCILPSLQFLLAQIIESQWYAKDGERL
ncbi:hypothetical protein LCGC14_2678930 [marine sediment metagenome]|uniref:Uncharacterized protein n=1 Tax=marine sediment metagenome TaxID=412755 RepID=A0A0F8ZLU9_9ZZZZ